MYDTDKYYKKCGAYEKAIQTLKEVVVCNQKLTDSWAMARNYEQMVQIYLENYHVQFPILKETIVNAFIQFRMSESLDKGLQLISKVTKKLQSKGKAKQAMELLQEAYRIAMEDEKSFKKKQIFSQIIENFIQNQFYEEAIKMYYEDIKRKNGQNCEQEALIIIILEIILGQMKRAETEMFDIGNIVPSWLTSNDCESAQNLIKFYKEGQPQKFKKQTTRAAVTTLFPLVIIRKLRNVVVPSADKFNKGSDQQKEEMIEKMLF